MNEILKLTFETVGCVCDCDAVVVSYVIIAEESIRFKGSINVMHVTNPFMSREAFLDFKTTLFK